MRTIRACRASILACMILTLSACATSGTAGGGEGAAVAGDAVAVRVNNDVVPPTTITVWMVPETGARRRLGTVTPNGQETFSFAPGIRSMEHRLMAETTEGGDRTTNPFTLVAVSGVRWNVSSPNVGLDRGGE